MRRLIARYWGLCSQVDAHCGTILQTLEACGLWHNTIIVFTSDHGDMMGSYQLIAKCVMYEEAVRVPLLVKLPGQRQGVRVNGPVSQIDLVPTLLDALACDAPSHLQGRSLTSRMGGAAATAADDVVIEWNGANNGLGADVTNGIDLPEEVLKLAPRERIEAAITDPLRTLFSTDGRWKLTVSTLGEHALADLVEDPGERTNLYGEPRVAAVTADLRQRLRRWQERTRDGAGDASPMRA